MFCQKCGNQITENSKFCGKCGNKNNEDSLDKQIEATTVDSSKDYDFLNIPVSRLVWVSILSFGFYPIYWFYYNWNAIKKVTGEKMSPFWRGVFSIFWSNTPFELAQKQAKKLGYKHNYNANILSVFYFIAVVVDNAVNRYSDTNLGFSVMWLIVGELIVLLPIIKVQTVVNWSNDKKGKIFDKIGRPEIGLIVISWVIVILIAFVNN